MRVFRNSLKELVDVAGIEPATPCLQNSSASFRKSRYFNHRIDKLKA